MKGSIRLWNVTEAPDAAHMTTGGGFASSAASLDIEPTAVPRAVTMIVLAVLRMPLRAMCPHPLRRHSPLDNRQSPGQQEHDTATGQCPGNLLSCIRQHG